MTGTHQQDNDGRMQHYVHDDAGYLAWVSRHPDGFVINTYTRPSRAYLKLHKAACPKISRLQRGALTFTDGEYSKICGSRAALEEEASNLGGTAQPCPFCLWTSAGLVLPDDPTTCCIVGGRDNLL